MSQTNKAVVVNINNEFAKKQSDWIQKINFLVEFHDQYWISINRNQQKPDLPAELYSLRRLIDSKTLTLDKMAEEAQRLSVVEGSQQNCLMPLYQLIMVAQNGNGDATQKLTGLQKEIDDFYRKKIVSFVFDNDEYWMEGSAEKKLAEGLAVLRSLGKRSEITLKQLADKAAILKNSATAESFLIPLYDLLISACNGDRKFEKRLTNLEKEIIFFYKVRDLNNTIRLSKKPANPIAEARAYFELGVLFYKKDNLKLGQQAFDYFTQAIQSNANLEIKAYALKERSQLFGAIKKSDAEKLKDLKEACDILDSLKEIKEDKENKERARTYLYYGEALMAEGMSCSKEMAKISQDKYQQAIRYLDKARRIRPDNPHTITALLQTHNLLKGYKNALECIRDVNFDTASLQGVDEYLSRCGLLPLWLEAARWGSVGLIEYLAPHVVDTNIKDKQGDSALHYAAREGHEDLIPYLARYLNLNSQNKKGFPPVFVAAENGRTQMVMALLQQGVQPATDKNDLLSVIIENQQTCILEELASDRKRYQELLTEIGKLYYKPDHGKANDSRTSENEKTQKERLQREATIGHLYQKAISVPSLPILALLIKYHPEGLLILYRGQTPLHFAVQLKYEEGVRLLVGSGSNLQQPNADKKMASELAVQLKTQSESIAETIKPTAIKTEALRVSTQDLTTTNNNNNKMPPNAKNTKEDSKVYTELSNYLDNALQRKKDEQRKGGENRKTFIERIVKQFQSQVPKEKAELVNSKGLQRLNEQLVNVLERPVYASLFETNNMNTLNLLQELIIKTLLEKLQKKDEITKVRGITRTLMFDKQKLNMALIAILESPWQRLDDGKIMTAKTGGLVSTSSSSTSTTAVGLGITSLDKAKTDLDIKVKSENKMLSLSADIFCDRFEKQLDEAYGYFRAVANGEAIPAKDIEDQRKAELGKQLASHLPNVPIPMTGLHLPTGTIVSGAMDLMLYFRQRYRKKQAERMVNLFKAVTPYERTHFIRYTAELLADKYHDQIHHLTPGSQGVEQFADCAAARVVEYITSDDSNQIAHEPSMFSNAIRIMKSWVLDKEIPPEQTEQKSLFNIFLDGIVRVTSDFPKDKERLQTINHLTLQDNWISKGIFENTGIITASGERYAHPNVKPNLYGFCKGTKEEALKRDLNLGPNPSKGQFWGEGRIWEKPADTIGLTPLPANQVTSTAILPGYQTQLQSASNFAGGVVSSYKVQNPNPFK